MEIGGLWVGLNDNSKQFVKELGVVKLNRRNSCSQQCKCVCLVLVCDDTGAT